MTDTKMPKNAEKYTCLLCAFGCCKKSNYTAHILTSKHINNSKILTNTAEKMPKNASLNYIPLLCDCGKKYKHRQSLFNHKNKCLVVKNNSNCITEEHNIPLNKDDLITYLIKENNDFKEMIVEQNKVVMEMCEKGRSTICNSNNINSHNKTFNLNVFLNEQCKDAMNIMDFVDSLKLQLSDLEIVGKLGFVEGISNIIVKNLKALDIHKRPVHCSDSKRDVMYVKDENKWEKESDDNHKLRKAIKHIAHKNTKLLPAFKAKHPDCVYSDSKVSDQYNTLIVEAMGGKGDNDSEKEYKIIKKIAKEVTISKAIDTHSE
jgi:hypothetical protein